MRKKLIGLLTLTTLALAACGEDVPPPAAPPPPPPATEPPPVAVAPPVDTAAAPPPKPAMADLQAAALKSAFDAINAHDAQKYAAVFAPDGAFKDPSFPDAVGREAIAGVIGGYFTTFPNLKCAVVRSFSTGNVLVDHWACTGTDSGGFAGKKATNRPAGVEGVGISWFNDDGTIKEFHHYWDPGTIVSQLDPKAKAGSFRAPPTLPSTAESYAAAGTPDEDKNLALAKTAYQNFDDRKKADLLALVTDDTTVEDYAGPTTIKGAKGYEQMYKSYVTAFPDAKQVPLSNLWAVKDFVIAEGVFTGTHKGKVGPLKATNKPVSLHFVDIAQMKDGKVAHEWSFSSSTEFLTQIGVLKPAGAAKADDKGAETSKKGGAGGDKGSTDKASK